VRLFEQPDTLLANTWIVVRIDGRGFSKYVFNSISFFLSFESGCRILVPEHAGSTRHTKRAIVQFQFMASGSQLDCDNALNCIVPQLMHRPRLTTKYKFVKPNDRNALDLMNAAAEAVMKELPDLVLAYGNSDEFRYVKTFILSSSLSETLYRGRSYARYHLPASSRGSTAIGPYRV
jgi:tRNA(His) 5'-end guanylyltransferase